MHFSFATIYYEYVLSSFSGDCQSALGNFKSVMHSEAHSASKYIGPGILPLLHWSTLRVTPLKSMELLLGKNGISKRKIRVNLYSN